MTCKDATRNCGPAGQGSEEYTSLQIAPWRGEDLSYYRSRHMAVPLEEATSLQLGDQRKQDLLLCCFPKPAQAVPL